MQILMPQLSVRRQCGAAHSSLTSCLSAKPLRKNKTDSVNLKKTMNRCLSRIFPMLASRKEIFPTIGWVPVLFLLAAACASPGPAAGPIARTGGWFSYLGGDDVRRSCQAGAPETYRIAYNGIYI